MWESNDKGFNNLPADAFEEHDEFELESGDVTEISEKKVVDEIPSDSSETGKDQVPLNDGTTDDFDSIDGFQDDFSSTSIEDEIAKKPKNTKLSILNDSKFKKFWIIGWAVVVFIIIVLILISLLMKDDEPRKIITTPTPTSSDEIVEDDFEDEYELETEDEDYDEDYSESNTWSEDDIVTADNEQIDTSWNINVESNSSEEVIDITEAILSPSSVKVKLNSTWEFDGTEPNTDSEAWFVTVKENSLVIPTVSRNNFIADIQIEVLNTETQFTTSDLIKVKYNVLLNSKTLSYTLSKKIYQDRDFVIELTTNPITSDIVSKEPDLKKEELTIPINIMTPGEHTVWFKLDGYPLEKYTFNIK